jgi:hypothetical protein
MKLTDREIEVLLEEVKASRELLRQLAVAPLEEDTEYWVWGNTADIYAYGIKVAKGDIGEKAREHLNKFVDINPDL